MTVAVAVRTPFVLVTSLAKPNGLKKSEISEIFTSPRSAWHDNTQIRIILRPKSDSDTQAWIENFPGMEAALEAARKRHDVPVAATDQDSANMAETIAGSLAGSTLTQITTEQRNLRLVSVDGVAPTLSALESGTYPYRKMLYFVIPAKSKPDVDRFLAFVRSPDGQALLKEKGNLIIPVTSRP